MDQSTYQNARVKDFLSRHVTAIDLTASIIILMLVLSTVFFSLRSREYQLIINDIHRQSQQEQINTQVLEFTGLFVNKVLKAEGEIDFETRLKLESSVRALRDSEVLRAWQNFTESSSERAAQDAVKELLSLLVSRIK